MGDEPARFYCEHLPDRATVVELDEHAAHHAGVLRIVVGEAVELFDGSGRSALGRVVALEAKRMCVAADEPRSRPSNEPHVTLLLAVPKAPKLDTIVRMCTEVGVTEIRFVRSERSMPLDTVASRVTRLERITREAARQSRRATIPKLVVGPSLVEAAESISHELWRVAFYESAVGGLPRPPNASTRSACVVVGAEGGLSPDEAVRIREAGYVIASLGESTLRVETAAVVGLCLVLDRLRGLR